MRSPNDNLRRLLMGLAALVHDKRATAALQAIFATHMLLAFFLFGQDFFVWWRLPMPEGADTLWVGLMTILSFALCAWFTLVAMGMFSVMRRGAMRRSLPRSRIVGLVMQPVVYWLPGAWGWAYLTGQGARFWGTTAIAVFVSFQTLFFLLATQEAFAEARRRRAGGSTPPTLTTTQIGGILRRRGQQWRLRQQGIIWRRWWRLTHPRYLERRPKIDQALFAAVVRNDAARASACLEGGANPSGRGMYGIPLLRLAAQAGHVEIVQLLLKHGAEINARDGQYRLTALMAASAQGRLEAARTLLEAGADQSLKSASGQTALEMARRNQHAAVAARLEG